MQLAFQQKNYETTGGFYLSLNQVGESIEKENNEIRSRTHSPFQSSAKMSTSIMNSLKQQR